MSRIDTGASETARVSADAVVPPAAWVPPKVVFSVQVLRGLAASLVVIRHATNYANGNAESSFPTGQVGVDIFFVISGIVIFLTGRKLSWHVFLRRRIARIAPIYWVFTAMVVVGYWHGGRGGDWQRTVLPSLFFIPAHDSVRTIQPPIEPGWTLNYEMYFYLVCTLVLVVLPSARRFIWAVSAVILAGVAVGAVLVWPVGPRVVPAPLILLLPISLEFLAGMWLARAWQSGVRTPPWASALLIVGAILWLVFLFPDNRPYTVARPLTWGIPAAAILWAFLSLERHVRFARWRFPLLVGDASYAVYLSHPVALSLCFAVLRRVGGVPWIVSLTVALVACIVAGIVVHKVVELPLVRVTNRLLGLRKSTGAAGLQSHDIAKATVADR